MTTRCSAALRMDLEQEQQTLIIAVLIKGLTVLQSNRQLKGKSAGSVSELTLRESSATRITA